MKRGSRLHPLAPIAMAVLTTSWMAACGVDTVGPGVEGEVGEAEGWSAYTFDQLRLQREQANLSFLEFVTTPGLRAGLYHQQRRFPGGFISHPDHVVYYVVNGNGTLSVEGTDYALAPGTTFFVRAQAEHQFYSDITDIDLLVVFGDGAQSPDDPEVMSYLREDLLVAQNPNENVLNFVLETSMLDLAMYTLPRDLDGAGEMAHGRDEVMIVVRGGSRLDLGPAGINVGDLSIVFVEAGLVHRFRLISDDLEILLIRAP